MTKLTKSQNPYGVTGRSIWEAKQISRRGKTFTVKKIVYESGEYFADCLYDESGKRTFINLLNFRKYQRLV
jgi:hypothetical protein